MRNILFVCNAGVDRSPAAAWWAENIAEAERIELKADSLGIRYPTCRQNLRNEYFEEYDRIFVMENWMQNEIQENYSYSGDIVSLDIEDREDWTSRELDQIFERKFTDEGLRAKILYE